MTAVATLPRTASVDDVCEAIDRDGYAIIENYLSPEDVAAKKADLQRVLQATPRGRNDFEGFDTQRIYAFFAKTRTFDAQATDPLVMGVNERFLGANHQLSAPVGISIGPGETAQNLHRDDGVYPLPMPHPPLVMNTMWPLDDFTAENGATHVVPGSHRWADRTPAEDEPTVRAVMPAGSLMFFIGTVFHAGGANQTQANRLGVILEYCAGWLRPQENHYLAVPKEIVRDLDPKLQSLLGYHIHGNLLGNVDGRHPLKFLQDDRNVRDGVVVPE
ncbi:MAG: phytanoyl-CoA dioxygenase family protein [Dehalococcoidia bacterium]|nr:phytanoyl-CoA dioxygenase family protein [Dehalococcoidia bacterium]